MAEEQGVDQLGGHYASAWEQTKAKFTPVQDTEDGSRVQRSAAFGQEPGAAASNEADEPAQPTAAEVKAKLLAELAGAKKEPAKKEPEVELEDGEEVEAKGEEGEGEEEEEKPERVSPKLAALAKRERENQKRAQSLRDREAAVKAREKEFEEVKGVINNLSDPRNLYRLLGQQGAYQFLQFMANGGQLDPQQEAMLRAEGLGKELREIKQQLADGQKRGEEQAKAAEQQKIQDAVAEYKGEVKEYVSSEDAKGDHPYLTSILEPDEAVEAIYAEVERAYEETGKQISKRQAAKNLEAKLAERLQKVAPRQVPVRRAKTQTLTNSAKPSGRKEERPLTDQERRNRAVAMLEKAGIGKR